MPTALFALNDPDIGISLAATLAARGWHLLATANVVAVLRQHGIVCTDIADWVGIHDSPVVPTLHPKVETALSLVEAGSESAIDLVFDQPYPLAVGMDIGGHTLLGLALKGRRVALTTTAEAALVDQAIAMIGSVPPPLRDALAAATAARLTAFYADIRDGAETVSELANGENPYQIPASLVSRPSADPLALSAFANLGATAPCYTNLADLDGLINAAVALGRGFHATFGSTPHVCLAAKHGNPCGIAIDAKDPMAAVEGALWAEPIAIWGGELLVNFPVDGSIAAALTSSERRRRELGSAVWMLDVVAMPACDADAAKTLRRRTARKVFINPGLGALAAASMPAVARSVRGGELRQPGHDFVLDLSTASAFSDAEKADLLIAWAAAFFSFHGGNEVAIAKDGHLLATGGGPSTVHAARTAIDRARASGHDMTGSTFAADAFFPFTDAPALLADAGCRRGAVPSGGVRFAEVAEFFASRHIAVHFLPDDIRGFIRH